MVAELAAFAGWTYLVVALLVVADAVFPLVPAEVAVVSAGVLAAGHRLALPLVIAGAAVGAFGGDCLAYLLGRGAGRLGVGRLLRHPRSRAVLVWASERLGRRAVPVLVAARFVPGGRTASTITAGFLRVRPRVFLPTAAAGGTLWAAYTGGLGYLAGRAAADRPWVGVLVAAAVLTVTGAGAELARRRARRTREVRRADTASPAAASAAPAAPAGPAAAPAAPAAPAGPAAAPAGPAAVPVAAADLDVLAGGTPHTPARTSRSA